jgi:hypothetical protein
MDARDEWTSLEPRVSIQQLWESQLLQVACTVWESSRVPIHSVRSYALAHIYARAYKKYTRAFIYTNRSYRAPLRFPTSVSLRDRTSLLSKR